MGRGICGAPQGLMGKNYGVGRYKTMRLLILAVVSYFLLTKYGQGFAPDKTLLNALKEGRELTLSEGRFLETSRSISTQEIMNQIDEAFRLGLFSSLEARSAKDHFIRARSNIDRRGKI